MNESKWNDEAVLAFVREKIINRLTLVGEFVEGAAKNNTPVKTGNLQRSINYKVNDEDLSVTIGTPVEYAPYVEFGTTKRGAKPYLRPALYENKQEIKKILKL